VSLSEQWASRAWNTDTGRLEETAQQGTGPATAESLEQAA